MKNINNKTKTKTFIKTFINLDENKFNKYKIINNSQNNFENSIFPSITTNNRTNKFVNRKFRTKSEFYDRDFERINGNNNNLNNQHSYFFTVNGPEKFNTVTTRQNGFLYLSLGKVKYNNYK